MLALSSLNAHSLTRGNRVYCQVGERDVEIISRIGHNSTGQIWAQCLSGTELIFHPNQKVKIVL